MVVAGPSSRSTFERESSVLNSLPVSSSFDLPGDLTERQRLYQLADAQKRSGVTIIDFTVFRGVYCDLVTKWVSNASVPSVKRREMLLVQSSLVACTTLLDALLLSTGFLTKLVSILICCLMDSYPQTKRRLSTLKRH